jgi:hypothetical protein
VTAANDRPPQRRPAPPACPSVVPPDRWRKLALYAFAAIETALDADPGERIAILAEAATELDGGIDELDGAA